MKSFTINRVFHSILIRIKNIFRRTIYIPSKILIGKSKGILFVYPNYIFRNTFTEDSTIIDAGCGYDADFSVYMIKKYDLKAIGIDPTKKHIESLKTVSNATQGKFTHKLIAISATNGSISFNESEDNVSGSILKEHKNIQRDKVKTYDVESINLKSLPAYLGLKTIEYIKLDLEGAEYAIFKDLKPEDIRDYKQIFIEFHHHYVPIFSQNDTTKAVAKLKSYGFKSYSVDNRNYLFYK